MPEFDPKYTQCEKAHGDIDGFFVALSSASAMFEEGRVTEPTSCEPRTVALFAVHPVFEYI